MKTKLHLSILLVLLSMFAIKAQNFTDNFANESIGATASQWEPVKGSAVIGELAGQKVLNLDRYTVLKPVVNGLTTNYLGNQFTIEFDAYFYDVSIPTRQYYIIHLWEGTGVYGENDKHTDPYLLYKHGIRVSGSVVNNRKLEPLANLEKSWRHFKIEFAQNTLKIYINNHLIHNQPDLFYKPPMVSFSARNASTEISGITNITITDQVEGMEEETTEEETDAGSTNNQNLPYSFPDQDGEANQILQTDGNGTLNWVDYVTGNATGKGSTGLEALDEGDGIGWRLIGRDPDNYGSLGVSGVDLSFSTIPSTIFGATGRYSMTMGQNTMASGYFSVAMGNNTISDDDYSTVIGKYNNNTNSTSTLFQVGNGNLNTRSNAFNIDSNGTVTAPSFNMAKIVDDRALVTKEYVDSKVSSGLTIIDEGNGIGWRLVGRIPSNYGNIGENAVDFSLREANSSAHGATGKYSTAMGYGTISSNISSTAMGYETIADDQFSTVVGRHNDHTTSTNTLFQVGNGDFGVRSNALTVLFDGTITAPSLDISEIIVPKSLVTKEYVDANTALGLAVIDEGNGLGYRLYGRDVNKFGKIGRQAVDLSFNGTNSMTRGATGSHSLATGLSTTSSGVYSTSMGFSTEAKGSYSTALGSQSKAEGGVSTAFGFNSMASGDYSTAMGYNTIASGANSTAMGEETEASGTYSTAMGRKTVSTGYATTALGLGTVATDQSITVVGQYNTYRQAEDGVLFQVGNGTSNSNRSDALSVTNVGNAHLSGNLFQNSDRRLKKDINELQYGLNEILKLKPVSYNWKKFSHKEKSFGLIAQDVQLVIKEIVQQSEDINQTLNLSYIELIPVLINAIKEQQAIIENLKSNGTDKDQAMAQLNERLENLENYINNK